MFSRKCTTQYSAVVIAVDLLEWMSWRGRGGGGETRTTSLAKLWCTPNRRHFASPTPSPPFLSKVFSTKEQLSIGKCIAYLYIRGDTSVSIEESPCLPYSAPLQLHVWRNYDPIQIGNIFTSPPLPCLFSRVVLLLKFTLSVLLTIRVRAEFW